MGTQPPDHDRQLRDSRAVALIELQGHLVSNGDSLRTQLLESGGVELADSEWFYLVSMSCAFPAGVG